MASPAGLTHADLTAKLVLEGCLRIAEGKELGKMPVEALPLTGAEMAAAGVDPGGLALFYALGETGVFFNIRGAHARVWFNNEDCDGALETFERALQAAYPQARFAQQVDHPVPGMRVRLYRVDLDKKHLVDLEVTYPMSQDAMRQFIVRVHAQERR